VRAAKPVKMVKINVDEASRFAGICRFQSIDVYLFQSQPVTVSGPSRIPRFKAVYDRVIKQVRRSPAKRLSSLAAAMNMLARPAKTRWHLYCDLGERPTRCANMVHGASRNIR